MGSVPISEAQARITHARGTGFAYLRSTLKVALYGGRWELLLARLSPAARAVLSEAPSLDEWIPVEVLHEIHLAQQDLPHPDTRKVRGELMAEAELTRRELVHPGSGGDPRPLILRFPFLWPETHQGGCVTIDRLEEGQGEMSVWATFPYPDYLRDVAPAWLRQALVMAGARQPRVDYLGPGTGDPLYRHRYWLAWDP